MELQKVYARVILEMLGAPKEYIEQTMHNYVGKIKKEGVDVRREKFEEAKKQDKLFSTFAELEIEFTGIPELLTFCFEALPSSVEILEPTTINLPSSKLTDFLNDLQARLHDADMIIKTTHAQNKLLDSNTTAVFDNFIVYVVKQGPATLDSLASAIGVLQNELQPFLKKLVEAKKISFDGKNYTIL